MERWRHIGALVALALVLAGPAAAQKAGDPPLGTPMALGGQLPFAQTEFGGMDVYRDSAHLPPSAALSAVNVLTEHGYIEKRPGSVLASAFPSTVENMVGFVNQGGTWLMVAHSSASLYSTNFGSPPVAIATVTVGQPVEFLTAFNKLIAVDGTTEVEYDGTSTGTTTSFPQCQYLEFDQQRVWCAKVKNESLSEVRISSVGGLAYWTVPPDPTIVPNAPNFFYINYQDGQPITCMKKTPWGIVVGKNRSLWIIKGYDNTNWYIRNVDPAIGCVDNRSMQMVDGRLEFASVDGIYSWTGAGPLQLESLPVDPVYQSARQSSAQQQVWTTQQQADWAAGTLNVSGPGAPMSATMYPGNLVPSSFTFITQSTTSFASGTMTSLSTTVAYGLVLSTTQLAYSWSVVSNGGSYSLYVTSAVASSGGATWTSIVSTYTQSVGTFTFTANSNSASGLPFYFLLDSNSVNGSGALSGNGYALRLAAGAGSGFNGIYRYSGGTGTQKLAFAPPSGTNSFVIYRDAAGNFSVTENGSYIGAFNDTTYGTPAYIGMSAIGGTTQFEFDSFKFNSTSGSFTSASFDTTLSTPVWGNLNIAVSSGNFVGLGYSTITFYTETSSDNVSWSSLAIASPTVQITSPNREFIRWIASFTVVSTGPAGVLPSPSIQNVTILSATTGYYYSPVHFVGSDISSWASYDVGVTLPMTSVITGNALTGTSTITYQIRSATYAFSATAASPDWSSQQPNTTISISASTPTYVQWNGLLNFSNAEIAPVWNLASVNWNTGLQTAPAASAYLLHRYFLCLAITSSNNDTCLVQQRTRDWVKFTGQSIGAFSLFNGTLYGGSGLTDGSVWREMQNGVYNDAGVAIDSSWSSGDLMFGDPVGQKVLDEIWLDAAPSSGTTLNVRYGVDRSTTVVTKGVSLTTTKSAVNKQVPIDSRFSLGKYFRLEFENAQDAYFRVNAFTIFGRYKPRTD